MQRIKKVAERIIQEFGIALPNQRICSKKGLRLYLDSTLKELSEANSLEVTIGPNKADPTSKSKSYCALYVFDKSRENSKDNRVYLQKVFDQFINNSAPIDSNYMLEKQIVDKIYGKTFEEEVQVDKSKISVLRSEAAGLLELEQKYFRNYSKSLERYLKHQTKVKFMKRELAKCENQLNSLDVLLQGCCKVLDSCKEKRDKFADELSGLKISNQKTIDLFSESLEAIKKIELHQALRSEKAKTLFDVYFDTEKMYKWKNTCIQKEQILTSKFDQFQEYFVSKDETLREDKISKFIPLYNYHETLLDTLSCLRFEEEPIILSEFLKVHDDYKEIRLVLECYGQDNSNADAQRLLEKYSSRSLDKEAVEQLATFIEKEKPFDEFSESIREARLSFGETVISHYKKYEEIQRDAAIKTEAQLEIFSKELPGVAKDFSFLLYPMHMPEAYKKALLEIARRRTFSEQFNKKYNTLEQFVKEEQEQRKQFALNYGRYLPSDFIPSLKQIWPELSVKNKECDASLPLIGEDAQPELQAKEECNNLARLQDLVKEFEIQKERNKALKMQISQSESQEKLSKENGANATIDPQIQKFKEQLNSLSKILEKEVPKTNLEVGIEELALDKENPQNALISRIKYLGSVVQLTTKTCYELFHKKLLEKQDAYNKSLQKFEIHMMSNEECFAKERTKLILDYEQRIMSANTAQFESADNYNKILKKLEEKQKELDALKKTKSPRNEPRIDESVSSLKTDLELKNEQILLKNQRIEDLLREVESLTKQLVEDETNLENYKAQVKKDHAEVLKNVHAVHKIELENSENRCREKQMMLENRNAELQRLKKKKLEFEVKLQEIEEMVGLTTSKLEKAQKNNRLLNDENLGLINRLENQQIVIQNKDSEIASLKKAISENEEEKNSFARDLDQFRDVNAQLNKKMQALNEKIRLLENERDGLKEKLNRMSSTLAAQELELQKLQWESEEREIQLTERSRNEDNLKKKFIELDVLRAHHDMITEELSNAKKEIENLRTKGSELQAELDSKINELLELQETNNAERDKGRMASQTLRDLGLINEQLLLQIERKDERLVELEKEIMELYSKYQESQDKQERLSMLIMNDPESEKLKLDPSFSKILDGSFQTAKGEQEEHPYFEEKLALQELVKQKDAEIESLRGENAVLQEETDSIRAKAKAFEEKILEAMKEMNLAREHISNLMKEQARLTSKENQLKNNVASLQELLKQRETEIQAIKQANQLPQSAILSIEENKGNAPHQVDKSIEDKMITQLDNAKQIDLLRMEPGTRAIFIPFSAGVFCPLIIHQYTEEEIKSLLTNYKVNFDNQTLKAYEKTMKNNFVLDLTTIEPKYQELLEELTLLVVGTIKSITPMKAENDTQTLYYISLQSVEYMLGFDEEEMVLKNYVYLV